MPPNYVADAVGLAAGLFLGMLLFLEIGRRIGLRRLDKYGPDSR